MVKRLINPIISDSFFLFGARGTGKITFLTEFFKDLPVIWVVVDEIQKVPKLLNLVHHLIETKKLKFALTGSSARRLKQKGVNLLAGRAFTNYAFPLTHIELGEDFSLQDVLQWGSLPKLFSLTTDDARAAYLRSYGLHYVTSASIRPPSFHILIFWRTLYWVSV